MNVQLIRMAEQQADLVATWQLLAAGWSAAKVKHHAHSGSWRRVHPGVYALTHAPLARRQLWLAATLSAPNTVLSHASAGACFAFRPWEGAFEIVTRPGSGGPKRLGSLLICRSAALAGETALYDGIPVTTAERSLIDLAPQLSARELGRAFREAVRLKLTTAKRLQAVLGRHPGRRGSTGLGELAERYADLPYSRTRSNAEARALEVLHDGGIAPDVNRRVSGEEADLSWPGSRLIIEIDGPDFHRFADEDARKQRVWEAAGWTVRRLGSDQVYRAPERLVALARTGCMLTSER